MGLEVARFAPASSTGASDQFQYPAGGPVKDGFVQAARLHRRYDRCR